MNQLTQIKIVEATDSKEDVRGIQEVLYKTWLDTYPNKEHGITKDDINDRFKNAFSPETLKKRAQDIRALPEKHIIILAKASDEVIGLCRFEESEEINRLKALYVLPKFQNRGVGKMLWNKIQESINSTKDTIVNVASYNDKAISFYKSLGFIDTGKIFPDERFKMKSGATIPEMEMAIKKRP